MTPRLFCPLILLSLIVSGCENNYLRKDIPKSLNVGDITSTYSYDEFGGFGKGYTLEVYKLNRAAIENFINTKNRPLPDKKDTGDWHKFDWTTAPLDTCYTYKYAYVVAMVLNERPNTEAANIVDYLRVTLCSRKLYYSLYYKLRTGTPDYVELFAVDTEAEKLYIIESTL